MKKILAISLIVFLTGCSPNKKSEIIQIESNYVLDPKLSLADYSEYKGYFPEEGFISTPTIAYQIAESILSNIYGKENIEKQKPFSIKLENGIWIIKGTLYSRKGGVAYIEIRKINGEILKVHHGE